MKNKMAIYIQSQSNLILYLYWILFFAALAIISLTIQLNVPLHNDNAFFLYAAEQFLKGGSYTKDFFDTNPPLIILLNAPIILISKSLSLDKLYVFYFYVLFFSLTALAYACYSLKQIIKDRVLFYFLVSGIASALIVMPNLSFGQREHLWVVLTLPYLFAAVLRLSDKPINLFSAFVIGIFAGIGFAIKPYFLTTFILIELFFMYKRKNFWGWVRPEPFCVLGVIVIYMGIIYQYFPDYVSIAVPLLLKYYHHDTWTTLFVNPFLIYSLLILGLYGIGWKKRANPILSQVLMLALLGSILAYLISRVFYFYHVLPMISFSIILSAIVLENQVKKLFFEPISLVTTLRYLLIWLTAVVVVYCAFPINQIDYSYIRSYQLPLISLALLTILFFDLTLQKIINDSVTKFFLVASLILTLAFSAKPFPQAEQLFLILMLPYFCCALLRLHHQTINHLTSLMTGIGMGIALSLNTHLFIPLILIECYFLFKEKSFYHFLKIELISSLLVAYGLSSGLLQPALKIIGLNLHWFRTIQIVALFTPLQSNVQFLELCNFIFCALVFILQMFSNNNSRYLAINHLLSTLLLGFIIYAFIESYDQNPYATLPALIIAGILVTLMLGDILAKRFPYITSNNVFANTCKVISLNLTFIFLFFYPLDYLITSISESIDELKKGIITSLASYLKAYPNSTYEFYGVEDYLMNLDAIYKHQFVGKFPMLWWYFAMIENRENKKDTLISKDRFKDEKFFIDGLAEKLNRAKPRFVITQELGDFACQINLNSNQQPSIYKSYNINKHCKKRSNPAYDYATVFTSNEHFKKEWKHYRLLTNIYYDSNKTFTIYERT